ncbi:hypothetical protein [Parafrankia sp. EUN1f]|uniref:phage tail fiber protein n=1 Tax=Parafrankia sp. EUN1f TaxID=102897 RepID=UPI0001C45577|nr:hypothetical protein [Parafrankia sp. EUN1f]EFC86462.1 hypothetical protein FrEUN1fDRAFT_0357 [Parafrankia sp. EUN1f]
MGALSGSEANSVLNATTTVATYTAPVGPLKARLMTANGSASAAGTEVTGGSYTAQTIAFGAASGGVASNSVIVDFANMPLCTVVGVEIWDSAGTPRRLWWGALSASKSVGSGDTFRFQAGSVSVSLP